MTQDKALPHKDIILPEVDLSHDDGDPAWHEARGQDMVPVQAEDGSIRHYRWTGLAPGHYREYWQLCVRENWEEAAGAYEAGPEDACAAWWYIDKHPVFWKFTRLRNGKEGYPVNHVCFLEHDGAIRRGWPEFIPHKVSPETRRIEDDQALNTQTEWWYEFGPSRLDGGCSYHDWQLDGGAASYEQCVIEVARKIWEHYGNDRRVVDSEQWRAGKHPAGPEEAADQEEQA